MEKNKIIEKINEFEKMIQIERKKDLHNIQLKKIKYYIYKIKKQIKEL